MKVPDANGAETTAGDAYARCRTGSAAGRGAVAGWTPCPLCSSSLQSSNSFNSQNIPSHSPSDIEGFTDDFIVNIMSTLPKRTKSVKLFSHGRGLAAHLHAVHTPWNPGKAEIKRRKALQKRIENERRRLQRSFNKEGDTSGDDLAGADNGQERCKKRPKISHEHDSGSGTSQDNSSSRGKWEPTENDINKWNQKVMVIVALVEREAKKRGVKDGTDVEDRTSADADAHNRKSLEKTAQCSSADDETKGRDRSGNACLSYRESLPPFLAAAADGDLDALRKCIDEGDTGTDTTNKGQELDGRSLNPERQKQIKNLLSLRDRNGSTAEHWAAGGGHLDCVSYLLDLRDAVCSESNDISGLSKNPQPTNKKVRRRRDGKTSLHYAARNGHNSIIDLLLSRHDAPPVDIPSGDGTTPLHMACYGGHPSTVKHLIEKHNANAFALNEWECGVSHWAAMSLGSEGKDKVIDICKYLKRIDVDFAKRQKQGHAPLHKAASRKNCHVIKWIAEPSTFSEEERKSMGLPDICGNKPSDIWDSVGGNKEFGLWMKEACDW